MFKKSNTQTLSTGLVLILIAAMNLFSSCNSKETDPEKSDNDFKGNALWIGVPDDQTLSDSLMYLDNPSPLFRKEFTVNPDIEKASLYITAAGYYHARINGERIGKNYLDPAWTNFARRVYYTEYDLTSELKAGPNCLGVMLGNGFYNPLPLRMWGHRNIRNELPTGQPEFIAKLRLEYENGKTEEIVTDSSWKYNFGPIIRNSVYLGDVYDAGKELEGWDKEGYDESSWSVAIAGKGPGGDLQKAFFPPVRIRELIKPVSINPVSNGKCIVDMGVNFTGHYRIHLRGQTGDTVSFRFGERIYEDGELNPMTTVAGQIKRAGVGGPGAPAIAWQTDSFIFGAENEALYSPEFTFHTYRYMEISGLNYEPSLSEVEGISLNTSVIPNSSFSCSSELINSIQVITERTFLANLISVQSDCPAREKFGYGGDLNATNEAYIYNFDMQSIYCKTVYDWVDAVKDSVFVDTAPFVGIKYCGLSWESSLLTTQYFLYLYYNDTDIIKELYEFDLEWMEKAALIHPDGIVDSGLSDHESLEPVPVELTGTSHYLQCARIMAEFAAVMDDPENEKRFNALAGSLKEKILEMYWKKAVDGPINRQTLFATLIYHDIIPQDEITAAADSLKKAITDQPSGHFITGIFGTKYIMEALSKTGNSETVFDIVNSTSYPGWGFMVDNGATTIWETWKESDNTFSNCHPMFGSVSEWLFRWLGGIRPDPDYPGFSKFQINPSIPANLPEVDCSYSSPHGKIVSNWINDGNGKQVYDISVPEGSIAMVKLQARENQDISMLKASHDKSFSPEKDESGSFSFELEAGDYTIVVQDN